jgi:RsiW-degrading membrane proteinase PrsW (M82 family)
MTQNNTVIPIHRPDALEMLFFFSCGIIMSVPITLFIAQYANPLLVGLDTISATLVSSAVLAPLVEEFSKIFPLFYRHGETQRSIFYLAVMVGLGFGLAEFLAYQLIGVEWYIRLPGLLFHPASTAISAYGIAVKKPIPFFAIAVGLHFANNFLALTNPLPISTSILLVGFTVVASWSLYKKTQEKIIT